LAQIANAPGATLAIDEFLADKDEKMVALPGGGGFLVKALATAPDYRDQEKLC